MPAIIYYADNTFVNNTFVNNTNTNINININMFSQLILGVFTFCSCIFINHMFFKKESFTTSYFMLHFLVNFIITVLCLPYFLTLFYDPNGINETYDNEYMDIYWYIKYTYPILIGLHTYHLIDYKNINTSEIIHHIITYIFYYISYKLNHPFYYVHLICMSGVPGGITYYMLFLEKINAIKSITEKYISMNINFWIRCPGCIIYSTLLYDRMIYMYDSVCPIHLFLIAFSLINGIYFTTTIVESYYTKLYKIK